MSFGGFGGAAEALSYMIKAYDMATPVFRAFGAEVEATTRKVQASLEQMNRAQVRSAEAATSAAKAHTAASRTATAATEREAAAAQGAAAKQVRAAAQTEAAFGRSSSALSKFGRNTLIAAAVVGAGSVDMATKFQANTLRMQTQAGATGKELDKIRIGLLNMAGQVGSTPNQLANGMYHIVSSMEKVLPAANRVNQELVIMKIAAEGAQIGHSNLEETTYALASAMNALHLQSNSAAKVMGELNAIVGSGDMTMQDLIDSFKSGIIPAAATFHISLQSIGAALAVMGDMGMRGALSGTRLRMAISLLAAPTKQAAGILETLGMSSHEALSTSDKMSKALANAGITVTKLSDDLRKPDGLKVALEDLNNHMRRGGLSANAAGAAIDRAFGGGRMGAAIKLLAENTDRLKIKFDQIGQSSGQFGSDWEKTSKTFRVEVDRAVASVEALGIKLGTDLLPFAGKALHDLESMANWLAKNKTVLDALGVAVISFSTVAIGSYFVGKLKKAMDLMGQFGGGVGSMGRWMFGTPGGPSAAIAGGSSPLTGQSTSLGGIWGITGTQIRVGSRMNPLAVTMMGAGSVGGVASSAENKGATLAPAAAAEERQIARDLKAGGAALDARIAAMEAATVNPFAGSVGPLPVRPAGAINNPATGTIGEGLVGGSTRPASGLTRYPVGMTAAEVQQIAATGGLSMASLKTFASTAMGGLMRGGMIAGMGVLGSQLIGSAIGGSTGHTVSSIGTGVSVGAGAGAVAGSIIPGMGTAIGAAVGAIGGGVVTGLTALFHQPSFGNKLAEGLTHDIAGVKKPVASALDRAQAIVNAAQVVRPTTGDRSNLPSRFGGPGAPSAYPGLMPGVLTPEQITKRTADFERAGNLIAGALEKGWSKFKFQDMPTMFSDLTKNLDKMPGQVQASAIESALAYARGLEKDKQLPAGATKRLLDAMKVQYPGFERFLGLSAQADVATFTKHFDFTQSEKKLSVTMGKMRDDFPQVQQAMDATTGDAQAKAAAMIKALQAIAITGTGPMKKQALADIAALRSGAGQDLIQLTQLAGTNTAQMEKLSTAHFKTMRQAAAAETKAMTQAVSSNTAQAFQVGSANFRGLAKNIAAAVGAGAEATSKGLQNITDQVNSALKGFGEKPLATVTVKSLSPGQLAAVITGQVSSGAAANPHATGAKVSSRTYMVGEEGAAHPEYVLATNPAYRNRNVGLWAEAGKHLGIPGFRAGGLPNAGFSGVNMAGQTVFPFPKGEPFTWERVDQGQDLLGPPGGPVLAIGPGVVSRASDRFGGFGPFYPTEQITGGSLAGRSVYYGHTKISRTGQVSAGDVIAYTQQKANTWTAAPAGWLELGFLPYGSMSAGNAIAPILHALAAGHMVAGAGGIGAVPQLSTPKIKGLGNIGLVAQGALNKITGGANKFLAAQAMAGMGVGGVPSFGASAWQAELRKIAQAKKWSASDWLWLVAAESGTPGQLGTGNPNVMNSIGAFGLGQFIPANYGVYGPGSDPRQHPTGVQEIDSMGSYIAQRYGTPTAAKAYHLAHNSYATGGRVDFAGAFANGGMFTARRPTMAMFGEGGKVEDVFAIPRRTGGMIPDDRTTSSTHTGPTGTSHHTTHSTSVVKGGTRTTTTVTTGTTPTGKPYSTTTVSTSPVAAHKPSVTHYTTGLNPLTDQIESHTAAQWRLIHAEHAKQVHDAAAAKKKLDAFLAQQVQTMLTAGGQQVGAFDQTRKQQQGEFGDIIRHGKIDILGDLSHLTVTAWKKIVSTMTSAVAAMPLDQQLHLAGTLTKSLTKREAPLFHEEGHLTHKIGRERHDMERRIQQAERLHKEAMTEHGRQRHNAMAEAHRDQLAAKADRHHIAAQTKRIAEIGDKIAASRPAQLANIAIAAGLKGVTSAFTATQSQVDKQTSIASLLAGVAPGVSLKKIGLTSTMLKASGLTTASAKALLGKGTDSSAYAAQIQHITSEQIPQYQHEAKQLQHLYQQALKTHNKKLQGALLTQIDAVTQATLKAYGDLQTAQVNRIEAIYTKSQTQVGKLQGSADIAQAIAGMAPGTNLASIGLGKYAGLTGTEGNANPMATANYTNWMLGGERGVDISAMRELQAQLPHLSGTALDTANAHILDLSKSILDLTNQINQNLIQAIQATAKTFQDVSDLAKGGTDLLGQIESLAPGTNLSNLGLSPGVLGTLGISGAAGFEGTGMDYITNLQSQQNGQLTPAQIAAATAGVNAINAGLRSQESPLANELQYYQGQLPNLSGQGRTDAINAMLGLASTIAGLEKSIGDNTDALSKLTSATNANTTATGQMTGTVAYQYQGQGYLASLSSESSLNLSVGG